MNKHQEIINHDQDDDKNPLGVFAGLCVALVFSAIIWAIIYQILK